MSNKKVQTVQNSEEAFIRYQKIYSAHLRRLLQDQQRGVASSQLNEQKKKITEKWHKAGILDENGNITEPYAEVIISNE